MKLKTFFIILLSAFSLIAQGQNKKNETALAVDESKKLAQSVLLAHGGENFKKIKSIVIVGSAELSSSDTPMPMSGSFAMIIEGEKSRFDLKMPFFAITQVYDGETIKSSMDGVYLPPLSQFGFAIIPHFADKDIAIVNDEKSKPNSFYATMPSGYQTFFEIDPKTNLVKSYKSPFEFNGASQETVVEIENWKEVEKTLLPEKFIQKFNFGQMAFYMKYKAKTINVNVPIDKNVYELKPNQTN